MHFTRTRLLVYAGVGLMLALFGLSQLMGGRNMPPPPNQTEPYAQLALLEGRPFEGSPTAPVAIVEFSDYECPFCARFHSDTLPRIRREYIDTGRVKFVFRNFPLSFHENAMKAAQAAECAQKQGKYWQMHNLLFDNHDSLGESNYLKWASDIGLDPQEFRTCLDEGLTVSDIESDLSYARNLSVYSAPTFFINGRPIVGTRDYGAFASVIDEEYVK